MLSISHLSAVRKEKMTAVFVILQLSAGGLQDKVALMRFATHSVSFAILCADGRGTVGWRVMEPTSVKMVSIAKAGRFWAVRADGELLALVLYKKGALSVRDLLMRLASIPANEPPKTGRTTRRTRQQAEPRPSKHAP